MSDEEKNILSEKTKQKLLKASNIIIGDTIATGTTLASTLNEVQKIYDEGKKPYPDIYIYSICGSSYFVNNPLIQKVAEKLTKSMAMMRYYCANAQFNMDESNGTDLRFIDAMYHPKSKTEIDDQCTTDTQGLLKCAIWDWGERFMNVKGHLKEIKEYFDKHEERTPKWLKEGIESSIKAE